MLGPKLLLGAGVHCWGCWASNWARQLAVRVDWGSANICCIAKGPGGMLKELMVEAVGDDRPELSAEQCSAGWHLSVLDVRRAGVCITGMSCDSGEAPPGCSRGWVLDMWFSCCLDE